MLPNMSERDAEGWKRRTDPRGRVYAVGVIWAQRGTALVPVELRVRCEKWGVDATMVRDVPVGEVVAESRAGQVKLLRQALKWPELSDEARKRAEELLEAERRPEDNLPLLELVADTYRAAGRAPAKAVHEELVRRGHDISRSQAGKLIMRCRQLGLLGRAEPRKGGEVDLTMTKTRRATR